MSRLRTLPGSMALFAGPSPATGAHSVSGIKQIYRVRSLDYDVTDSKEDVVVYGRHDAIGRERISPLAVNLSFSYYVTDVENEASLGFDVNTHSSVVGGILQKLTDEKNYFVFITDEGVDSTGLGGANGTVAGFGNGFISSYQIEGAVGSFPTASVQVQALTMIPYEDGSAQDIPAVNVTTGQQITAHQFTIPTASDGDLDKVKVIRPQDISLDLSSAGGLMHNISDACIQSFRISFDLNRQPVECLGSKTYRSREPQFPINVQFQVEALANELVTGASSLDHGCDTGVYAATVYLRNPSCTGNGSIAAKYTLSGLSLESQNWSTSAGGNAQTLSINWIGRLSASGVTDAGFFMSGISSY